MNSDWMICCFALKHEAVIWKKWLPALIWNRTSCEPGRCRSDQNREITWVIGNTKQNYKKSVKKDTVCRDVAEWALLGWAVRCWNHKETNPNTTMKGGTTFLSTVFVPVIRFWQQFSIFKDEMKLLYFKSGSSFQFVPSPVASVLFLVRYPVCRCWKGLA